MENAYTPLTFEEALGRPRRARLLDGIHPTAVAVISTLAVFGGLFAVFWLAPGSEAVRRSFFDPSHMWAALIGDEARGRPGILGGLVLNIQMFVVAEVLILIVGLGLALCRLTTSPVTLPLRVLSNIYTDIFRGVPGLLVIFILGFGIPALNLGVLSHQPPWVYGVVALTLTYSAFVSEVFRAGIQSVHPSQLACARSLGMTHMQGMRYVVLPQAVRRVFPPLLNDFIALQKDTSVVSFLGAVEAARAAQIYAASTFNYSSYVMTAIIFLILTVPLSRWADTLVRNQGHNPASGADK